MRHCWPSTACASPRPSGPISTPLEFERGHRTLKILRKGGKHAVIPLAPRTSRALDLYIGERTTGPIFIGAKGGRMDRYAADRMVKRLARRAGITKRISPHSLRHSFITASCATGASVAELMRRGGHANPAAALRYQHATEDRDAAIASALAGLATSAEVVDLRPGDAGANPSRYVPGTPAVRGTTAEGAHPL